MNDDMLVATSYWLYLSLRREGRDAEATDVLAPIHAKMDILENDTYHRLLLMFKGDLGLMADRPLAVVLLAVAGVFIAYRLVRPRRMYELKAEQKI